MTALARFLVPILTALSGCLPAQITVSNPEPATMSVEHLFQRADSVAVVNILSGDTEAYDVPTYKAKVVRSFKAFMMEQSSTSAHSWNRNLEVSM